MTLAFSDGTKTLTTEANVVTVEPGSYADNKQIGKLTIFNVQDSATYTCLVTSGEFPDSGAMATTVDLGVFGKRDFQLF